MDQLALLFVLLLGAVISVPVGERWGLPAPVLMTLLGMVLAVTEDGVPLGTGRLLQGEAAAAKVGGDPAVGSLGRLAVTREARGLGVGAALVGAIEAAARARGLTAVDLHAQTHALGFYERLGYVAYGPEFADAGMPHRAMRKAL